MGEEVYQKNEKIMLEFIENLKSNGLGSRTIRIHKSNIELLNNYLGNDEKEFADADAYEIESFIRWCIDKWMFNTVSEFISSLSSIKEIYQYVQQKGMIKDIKKIIEICQDKDNWAKKFNKHEKLLGDY